MTTAIVYYSKHHGNTKKLLDAIKAADPAVDLIDVTEAPDFDLSSYDRIGFASGIYFSNFAKRVKFEAADDSENAVKMAAIWQAEFDKRSDAATAELSNLIAKPKPANVTAKPATKVKTKPATADPETDDPDTAAVAAVAEEEKRSSDKEAKSLVARFKALDDDALAGCC